MPRCVRGGDADPCSDRCHDVFPCAACGRVAAGFRLEPAQNPVFRALWIASAVSYIGYEIRNYAAPLLMGDFIKPFGLSEGMPLLHLYGVHAADSASGAFRRCAGRSR